MYHPKWKITCVPYGIYQLLNLKVGTYAHVGIVSLADGDASDDIGRLDAGLTQVLRHQVSSHREPDAHNSCVFEPTGDITRN